MYIYNDQKLLYDSICYDPTNLYLTTNNQIFNLLERLKKHITHHRNHVVISSTVTLSYITILPCQSTAARLIIVHSFQKKLSHLPHFTLYLGWSKTGCGWTCLLLLHLHYSVFTFSFPQLWLIPCCYRESCLK